MKQSKTAHPDRSSRTYAVSGGEDYTFYSQSHFLHALRIERQRTERSKKPFLLLLLDISLLTVGEKKERCPDQIKTVLAASLREVDVRGWYEHPRVIGIIFTEMSAFDAPSIEHVVRKIYDRFCERLDAGLVHDIRISFHLYPEEKGDLQIKNPFDKNLYPDLMNGHATKRAALVVKHAMDFFGSFLLLALSSPLFVVIAIAVKVTSKGPVFFRQKRLGLNGKVFTFLKFRSMYTDSDPRSHREYITRYIGEQDNSAVEPGVFKLKGDRRVTPVGRILRKTSLDELPQLINVLKGDMSLVGPRPPIPYECELYDTWHRRRLLSYKPGITGLWQVMGRSRTTFDEMVRLDLKYINEWSLWLDFKILLKTPMAILTGEGAY